jgi:hypothetical protein
MQLHFLHARRHWFQQHNRDSCRKSNISCDRNIHLQSGSRIRRKHGTGIINVPFFGFELDANTLYIHRHHHINAACGHRHRRKEKIG